MNEHPPQDEALRQPSGFASAIILAGSFTLREMRNALAPYEISPIQYTILEECYLSDGSTVTTIAAKLPIAVSAISRQADQLFELGLLDRIYSRADRRVIHLRVTEKGRELIPRLMDAVTEREAELADVFTETERETFLALAAKYIASLS